MTSIELIGNSVKDFQSNTADLDRSEMTKTVLLRDRGVRGGQCFSCIAASRGPLTAALISLHNSSRPAPVRAE